MLRRSWPGDTRNAAEVALRAVNSPNIQLLVKSDAEAADGARLAAQQAVDEGCELILGPLFAQAVSIVGQVARSRNIPVIAFSTDSNVASRGIYLLSFLPETDVARIVQYAASVREAFLRGAHSRQSIWNGLRRYFGRMSAGAAVKLVARNATHDKAAMAAPIRNVAQVLGRADALFIPDGGDALPDVAQALAANGVNTKRIQLLGTGLWDDPRVFQTPALDGGWFAAPDGAGYRNFANRYAARFKQQPVRTATLAYDAVALVAALVKTQGPQRFSPEVLTNPSGFSGIDGLFRFRQDGTCERGLAIMRVTPSGPQIIQAAPRSFGPAAG